jgi:hypothetical protein
VAVFPEAQGEATLAAEVMRKITVSNNMTSRRFRRQFRPKISFYKKSVRFYPTRQGLQFRPAMWYGDLWWKRRTGCQLFHEKGSYKGKHLHLLTNLVQCQNFDVHHSIVAYSGSAPSGTLCCGDDVPNKIISSNLLSLC